MIAMKLQQTAMFWQSKKSSWTKPFLQGSPPNPRPCNEHVQYRPLRLRRWRESSKSGNRLFLGMCFYQLHQAPCYINPKMLEDHLGVDLRWTLTWKMCLKVFAIFRFEFPVIRCDGFENWSYSIQNIDGSSVRFCKITWCFKLQRELAEKQPKIT